MKQAQHHQMNLIHSNKKSQSNSNKNQQNLSKEEAKNQQVINQSAQNTECSSENNSSCQSPLSAKNRFRNNSPPSSISCQWFQQKEKESQILSKKSSFLHQVYFSEAHLKLSESITGLDLGPVLNKVMELPSYIFKVKTVIFLVLPLFIYLTYSKSLNQLIFYLIMFTVSTRSCVFLKKVFNIPRMSVRVLGKKPTHFRELQNGNPSFPSGDTSIAVGHAFMLSIIFQQTPYQVLFMLMPLAVGFSRLFTGCHRILDVIAAIFLVSAEQYLVTSAFDFAGVDFM